jgi:hypothetical protein
MPGSTAGLNRDRAMCLCSVHYLPIKMKKLLLLLLILPSVVQGQKMPLQGRFYPIKQDIGFENELFAFEGINFHLTTRHCQGKNIGQGKYQLVGDTLVLLFEDYPAEKDYTLVNAKKTTSDSATIHFTVKSGTKNQSSQV